MTMTTATILINLDDIDFEELLSFIRRNCIQQDAKHLFLSEKDIVRGTKLYLNLSDFDEDEDDYTKLVRILIDDLDVAFRVSWEDIQRFNK
jgi:hypothetical protein